MPKLLEADDILPLVALLTKQERVRLLRLMTSGQQTDSSVYAAIPPRLDEFHADHDLLAWDAGGWEQFS